RIKVHELRGKTKAELQNQLKDLKNELSLLRVAKVVRLSIAQVLTVTSQKQKAALRDAYKKKKLIPLDLRPKKTRAIRRWSHWFLSRHCVVDVPKCSFITNSCSSTSSTTPIVATTTTSSIGFSSSNIKSIFLDRIPQLNLLYLRRKKSKCWSIDTELHSLRKSRMLASMTAMLVSSASPSVTVSSLASCGRSLSVSPTLKDLLPITSSLARVFLSVSLSSTNRLSPMASSSLMQAYDLSCRSKPMSTIYVPSPPLPQLPPLFFAGEASPTLALNPFSSLAKPSHPLPRAPHRRPSAKLSSSVMKPCCHAMSQGNMLIHASQFTQHSKK
ncbi:hypothetical protein B296_00023331, partial [Ensete ventricosum]